MKKEGEGPDNRKKGAAGGHLLTFNNQVSPGL